MRTTVDISNATLRELRQQAQSSGVPFKQVLEETLQRGLASAAQPKPRSRFRVTPFRVGIRTEFLGRSLNQVSDDLEAEDHLTPQ